MNNFFLLLLQQSQQATSGKGNGMSTTLLFFLVIILVFYFFMIRPQQKRQKKIQEAREALKAGDKIVTIGGIHGKIVNIQDTTFIIEVEGGNHLKIEKTAVAIDEQAASKK